MRLQEKRRAATGIADTGRNLRHQESYPRAVDLQAPAERFAKAWINAALGFASCFFHALVDDIGPAVAAILDKARRDDLQLEPSDFPTCAHWNLTAILSGFSECNVRPTPTAIIDAVRAARLALPLGGGDPIAELQVILWREASAALLVHYARELKGHHRKARQVARLWRVLRNTIEPSNGDRRMTPIIASRPRFSPRAIAAIFGGCNNG